MTWGQGTKRAHCLPQRGRRSEGRKKEGRREGGKETILVRDERRGSSDNNGVVHVFDHRHYDVNS